MSAREADFPGTPIEQISAAEVRAQLERILAAPSWQGSRRRNEMLTLILEETLAGRGNALKGVTIAMAIFGRGADGQDKADAIVRVEARRLRRDLDCYYVDAGKDDPLRISIPKGGYLPHFERLGNPPDAVDATPPPSSPAHRRAPATAFGIAALACALLFAGLGLFLLWPRTAPAPVAAQAERGPAVLVRPLLVLGPGEHDRALASGLTHELITYLTRFPDFRLYAPMDGDLSDDDAREAARRLGTAFVLQGNVRAGISDVVVGMRLADAANGRVLWSETFRRAPTARDLAELTSEIAAEVAAALGYRHGPLLAELRQQIARTGDPSLSSYLCVLDYYAYRRDSPARGPGTEPVYRSLRDCLETAVALEPDYADAWAALAYLRLDGYRLGYERGAERESALAEAQRAADRALASDRDNVLALMALSVIRHYAGDYEGSAASGRRALELNPHDPVVLAALGWKLAVRGQHEEGRTLLERAIERSVNPDPYYFQPLAAVHLMQGDHQAMRQTAERATADGSGIGYSLLAIAQGYLGEADATAEALRRMAEAWPLLAEDPAAAYRVHHVHDAMVEALVAGLAHARATAAAAHAPGS